MAAESIFRPIKSNRPPKRINKKKSTNPSSKGGKQNQNESNVMINQHSIIFALHIIRSANRAYTVKCEVKDIILNKSSSSPETERETNE